MASMISRPDYINKLQRHGGATDRIKIITGVRRCGKSTLLKLFQTELRDEGIQENQILYISLEDYNNKKLLDGSALHEYVESKSNKDTLTYVFIDEVQLIHDYADVITSLRMRDNIDLYVTGSNNSLLSFNLPKNLIGRTQEIHMFPLSFKEYVDGYNPMFKELSLALPGLILSENAKLRQEKQFNDYLKYGSFPGVFTYFTQEIPYQKSSSDGVLADGWNVAGAKDYIDGTYKDILLRDIMTQECVKELPQLKRVINFMFSNIGSETSVNKIMDTINNEFKLTKKEKTLYTPALSKYLDALLDSFLFYKADVQRRGKKLLRTNAKYYAVDISMSRYILGGGGTKDRGHILENVIYLELLRRGYKVEVGKIGGKEIDFVAETPEGRIEYYQVAETVRDTETLKRELAPLEDTKDNYPKFLLTRDLEQNDYNGIQQINIINWLLGQTE